VCGVGARLGAGAEQQGAAAEAVELVDGALEGDVRHKMERVLLLRRPANPPPPSVPVAAGLCLAAHAYMHERACDHAD